jgi:hypothetical protein
MSDEPGAKFAGFSFTMPVERDQLIAYLEYALDEVAALSERSALLLRMVIAELEETPSQDQHREPVHKLS